MLLLRLHLRRRPPRLSPFNPTTTTTALSTPATSRPFTTTPSTHARTPVRTAKETKRREKLSLDELAAPTDVARPPLPPLPVDRARGARAAAAGTRVRKSWLEVPQGPLGPVAGAGDGAGDGVGDGVGPLAGEGDGAGGESKEGGEGAEGKRYPPVVQQALDNMQRLGPEIVLLTRVGGFYELYFDAATQWAGRLGLKLGEKRTVAGPVAMAGFPWWRLEQFLKVLVKEEGRYVAVCEEYPKAGAVENEFVTGEAMFERRVQRIVTPGTLIDEEWIEAGENHFLLAVENKGAGEIGLAWTDLGTGEVWCSTCGTDGLAAELGRIGPREVVVKSGETALEGVEGSGAWVLTTHDASEETEKKGRLQTWEALAVEGEEVDKNVLKKLSRLEHAAAARLLDYVESRLPGIDVKLQTPVRRKASEVMAIDVNSMRGLEIKATLRDGFAKGSLLHTINRTVTRGGKRLLGNWLTNPSTDIDIIEARLDMVEAFLKDDILREDIPILLKRTYDSQRIVQKFSLGRADADDLVALARTIEATTDILRRMERADDKKTFAPILKRLDVPTALAKTILDSIDEEGFRRQQAEVADVAAALSQTAETEEMPESTRVVEELLAEVVEAGATKAKKGRKKRIARGIENSIKSATLVDVEGDEAWVMKKTASPLLRETHARLEGLREAKGHLEVHLRNKLNVQSLTLKWSPQLGHFCHIKGKDVNVPDVISVSSSRTTRSFLHPEWTKLGETISNTRLRIRAEEKVVFQNILRMVSGHISQLRRNAAVLDELDVASSFALLAREQNLTRPTLTRDQKHKIVGGRHFTVEAGLQEQGRQFVSNDCFVGDVERLWLVTGPNMAGKSTFLRQNALISIIAQTGSFVPATHASLGIVDKIFSRIGSADNLYASQSTFMVEMLETAMILRNATPRSFVIMDEVGRGTAPKDGAAVAYAVLKHLVEKNKCRALFATHFGELGEWVRGDKKVATWCTDISVDKDGSAWTFVHRLRRGVSTESHALRVAKMAGMPAEVLAVAQDILTAAAAEDVAVAVESPKKAARLAAGAGARAVAA